MWEWVMMGAGVAWGRAAEVLAADRVALRVGMALLAVVPVVAIAAVSWEEAGWEVVGAMEVAVGQRVAGSAVARHSMPRMPSNH